MYNRPGKQKKQKISANDKLNSLQTVFSLQNLFMTPTVFPRASDWWKKSNVTCFRFLRRKIDTMSIYSIRISYNATLTFEKNMLIGWDFLKNPFTAIKYIFNNFCDEIDVCLVFKGNQEGRMIGLSTSAIFLRWYCTLKTDSSTAFSRIWRATFTARQIYGFLPMQPSSKYTYWYSFKLKNKLQVSRCCTSSTKRAALHCTHSILCVCGYPKKLLIYCR